MNRPKSKLLHFQTSLPPHLQSSSVLSLALRMLLSLMRSCIMCQKWFYLYLFYQASEELRPFSNNQKHKRMGAGPTLLRKCSGLAIQEATCRVETAQFPEPNNQRHIQPILLVRTKPIFPVGGQAWVRDGDSDCSVFWDSPWPLVYDLHHPQTDRVLQIYGRNITFHIWFLFPEKELLFWIFPSNWQVFILNTEVSTTLVLRQLLLLLLGKWNIMNVQYVCLKLNIREIHWVSMAAKRKQTRGLRCHSGK